MRLRSFCFASLVSFIISLVIPAFLTVFAASISIDPQNLTIPLDSTNSEATIQLNTDGAQVNALDLYITYPKDLVDITYVNQGPNFQTSVDKSFTDGAIHLSLAALDLSTGQLTIAEGSNVKVATIGFKPKILGSGAITIGGDTQILDANDSSNLFDPAADVNQNITISQPAPTSDSNTQTPNSPAITTSTSCQNINTSKITIEMNSVLLLVTNLQHKLNNISVLLKNYYNSQDKKSQSGNELIQQLDNKNTQINGFITTLKGTINSFDCSNPQVQINKFKTDTQNTEYELTNYKLLLIKLVSYFN